MRRSCSAAALMALAFHFSGCASDPAAYFRKSVGAELHWDGLGNATQGLSTYIGAICEQAGLGRAPACHDAGFGPREWGLFVQAGMNDIDLRCDSYLAWLDARRRSSEPTLKQIAAMAAATVGIMGHAGASAEDISIVGQAFGLASETFTNINSRLLMTVEQSTVQSIVLKRRQEFRFNASRVFIDNRPAAIHALRSYLTICMPFTIEMEINTTITAYERGGASALDRPRLITHQTIDPTRPLRPLTPRDPVGERPRPRQPPMEGYADIFQNYDPNRHTAPVLQDVQQALCVPREEWQKAGPLSRVHIAIYRQTKRLPIQTLALNDPQTAEIRGKGPCVPGGGRNYFERQTFANFGPQPQRDVLDTLLRRLRKLPNPPGIADAATLESADLRAAIVSARQQLKVADSVLQVLPEPLRKQFESHITRDLHFALIESDK